MFKKLIILSAITLTSLTSVSLYSQTYRVKAFESHGDGIYYKEVYEYDYVNEKPEFPGGDTNMLKYINRTREYPERAYKKGIEGKVTCSFVVNCDGSISDVSVLRGVELSLNKEAVRIISEMPSWTPGRHDGKTVPVRVVRTIAFRK